VKKGSSTVIPAEERARFDRCVRHAWSLARSGQVSAGYAELDLGLTWAETPALNPVTWQSCPPEPWAAELTALYRGAIVRFLAEHPEAEDLAAEPALGGAGAALLPEASWRETLPALETAWVLQQEARELRATSQEICRRAQELLHRCRQAQRSRRVGSRRNERKNGTHRTASDGNGVDYPPAADR
jgi:hypothetical protein